MLTGEMLIGGAAVRGGGKGFRGVNPATGSELQPLYGEASAADVDRACALAWAAFDTYRETPPDRRAAFLEGIATAITDIGDELIERAMAETGLPRGRLEGERARTVGQLRLFADVVREGSHLDARIDPRCRNASRCRVRICAYGRWRSGRSGYSARATSRWPSRSREAIRPRRWRQAARSSLRGIRAHPGTSELVGRAVQSAVAASGLPGACSPCCSERATS